MTPPWVVEIRGQRFGAEDCPFRWASAPDVFGWDSVRAQDVDNPGEHGASAAGPDLLSSRKARLSFIVNAYSPSEALRRYQDFATAWIPGETTELIFRTPGWTRTAFVRPRRAVLDLGELAHEGVANAAVEYTMLDPFWYDDPRSVIVPLGASSGGRPYPYSYPYNYGVSTPGVGVLANTGNVGTKPRLGFGTFTGVANPQVTVLETGERLVFTGLSFNAGTVLLVDFATGDVVLTTDLNDLTGAQNVSGNIDRLLSNWWTGSRVIPPPGATLLYSADNGDGFVAVQYRPAWLT